MLGKHASPVGPMIADKSQLITTLVLVYCAACSAGETADIVLLNGRVLTMAESETIAQAVAVSGERIVAVGTNADIETLIGRETLRIDLAGRGVTPGLIDSHGHLDGLAESLSRARLVATRDREEVIERLLKYEQIRLDRRSPVL